MKQYLIVFLVTIAIGQDTLITNAGVIYSGKIINSTPNYVEFFPKSWQYSTKLSTEKIKQLIDNSDQVKTEKDEKNSQQQTYSIANSPIVGIQSDNNIDIQPNESQNKIIKAQYVSDVLIATSGLIGIYNINRDCDDCNTYEWQDFNDQTKTLGNMQYLFLALSGIAFLLDDL